MKFYFSGGGQKQTSPEKLVPLLRPHVMISFFDLDNRRRDVRKFIRTFLTELKSGVETSCRSVFIDSGAFSLSKMYSCTENPYEYFESAEFEGYCERYASFMEDMKAVGPHVTMANLDVIGRPDLTKKNQNYFERKGLRPVPVVHLPNSEEDFPEGLRYLEEYLAGDYEIIGLGGIAGDRNHKKKIKWCDEAFRRIQKSNERRITKIHGFGVFDFSLISRYKWTSVDSTTWFLPATRGEIYLPKWSEEMEDWDFKLPYTKMAFSDQILHKENHYQRISKQERKIVDRWLDEIQTESFVLEKRAEFRAEANLNYWMALESLLD